MNRRRLFLASAVAAIALPAATATAESLADLSVDGMTVPNRGRPGEAISVRVEIENRGAARARGSARGGGGYLVEVVLSRDAQAPARPAPLAAAFREDGLLAGGRFAETADLGPHRRGAVASAAVKLPAAVPAGAYHLCAVVDPGNVVREADETNNTLCVPFAVVAASAPGATGGGPVVATRSQVARIDTGALAAPARPKPAAPAGGASVATVDSAAIAAASGTRAGSSAGAKWQVPAGTRATAPAAPRTVAVAGIAPEEASDGDAAEAGGAPSETVTGDRKLDARRQKARTGTIDRKRAAGASRPVAVAAPDTDLAAAVGSAIAPPGPELAEAASRAHLCAAPAALLGRVVDIHGAAVWGTSVEVWREDEQVSSQTTQLGTFRFDGLCPGVYRLRVPANAGELVRNHTDRYYLPVRQEVDLPATGATVDLVVSRYRVLVQGTISPRGRPYPDYAAWEVQVGDELVGSRSGGAFEARVFCCPEVEVAPRAIAGYHFEPSRRVIRLAPGEPTLNVDFEIWHEDVFDRERRQPLPSRELPPLRIEGSGAGAGQPFLAMPDLVGHPTLEAWQDLHDAGWSDATIEVATEPVRDSGQLALLDTVARQSPAAGQRVLAGTAVTLVSYRIAPDYRYFPSVVGEPIDRILPRLREGRIPTDVDEVNPCPPESLRSASIGRCRDRDGTVLDQDPGPGIYHESTVLELEVAKLPEPRAVPDAVAVGPLLDAAELLRARGFLTRVRLDRMERSAECFGIRVRSQSPAAGERLPYGSRVTLDVCYDCFAAPADEPLGRAAQGLLCGPEWVTHTLTEHFGEPPLNGDLY